MAWEWLTELSGHRLGHGGETDLDETIINILDTSNLFYTLRSDYTNSDTLCYSNAHNTSFEGTWEIDNTLWFKTRMTGGNWSRGCSIQDVYYNDWQNFGGTWGDIYMVDLGIIINHTSQEASTVLIFLHDNGYIHYECGMLEGSHRGSNTLRHQLYQNIMSHQITYNWESVPSISGKNGILNLSQIKEESINAGEPVSNATVLAFDSLGDVNIPSIIDSQMPVDPTNPTSVTVGYMIPALASGSYSALKILAKQDSIPKNEDDADKVVDIEEPTNILRIGSAVVSGLTPLSHYYFVVKVTDDANVSATSEPKDITLDIAPPGTFFSPDFSLDGRDIMRYNPTKIIHIDEVSSGYEPAGEGYDVVCGALVDFSSPDDPAYTIEDDILTTDHYFGWVYDVNDNQRIIPKNCILTFNIDVYFTSRAGYVDWYIKDEEGRTITYWCLDTKYSYNTGVWYNNKIVCTVEDGYITLCKYFVNDVQIYSGYVNIHMCCIDEADVKKMKYITYNPYRMSKIKNMSISWELG